MQRRGEDVMPKPVLNVCRDYNPKLHDSDPTESSRFAPRRAWLEKPWAWMRHSAAQTTAMPPSQVLFCVLSGDMMLDLNRTTGRGICTLCMQHTGL
jgi:hypothetical protein